MNRRRIVALAGVAVACLVVATGGCSRVVLDPGPSTSEQREIDDPTRVHLKTPGRLVIGVGPTASLTVTAGENVIDDLTAVTEDGELTLGVSSALGDLGDVQYDLVLPDVDQLTLSGSGSIEGQIAAQAGLTIRAEGSGSVRLEPIEVDSLDVRIAGTGDVRLEGTAARQDVSVEGTGSYDAPGLVTEDTTVEISGTGSADVNATGTLDAHVSGTGSVRYTGDPQVTSTVDGTGRVEKQ
ncbi:head GIN domain-containing protein [Cellulomonas sp. P22]|uniref:head GIN domain-containing protein n=1 Tax=Cellulomonas sp. P22 TaxID=3373189 RepID=UPI00379E86E2